MLLFFFIQQQSGKLACLRIRKSKMVSIKKKLRLLSWIRIEISESLLHAVLILFLDFLYCWPRYLVKIVNDAANEDMKVWPNFKFYLIAGCNIHGDLLVHGSAQNICELQNLEATTTFTCCRHDGHSGYRLLVW